MAEKNSIRLRQVKQCLIEDGWMKGSMGSAHSPHCVLGAFAVVEGWTPNTHVEGGEDTWYVSEEGVYRHSAAARAFWGCLEDAEYEFYGAYGEDAIINWNDAEERELEDVLAQLEACAQAEEAAGR